MARFTLIVDEDEVTLDIDIESNSKEEILEAIKKLTEKRLEELKQVMQNLQ